MQEPFTGEEINPGTLSPFLSGPACRKTLLVPEGGKWLKSVSCKEVEEHQGFPVIPISNVPFIFLNPGNRCVEIPLDHDPSVFLRHVGQKHHSHLDILCLSEPWSNVHSPQQEGLLA